MIKFRLYPENKSLYFRVYILSNRQAMRKFLIAGRVYTKKQAKRAYACVLTVLKGKCYGAIFFNLEDFTDSVVAHELQHAVFAFAERKKILSDPLFYLRSPETGRKLEEKLAEVAGELAWQFRWKCRKNNIGIKWRSARFAVGNMLILLIIKSR